MTGVQTWCSSDLGYPVKWGIDRLKHGRREARVTANKLADFGKIGLVGAHLLHQHGEYGRARRNADILQRLQRFMIKDSGLLLHENSLFCAYRTGTLSIDFTGVPP